jgi:signal transduction histidine kinase/ActR/RegA family two-component response regulator
MASARKWAILGAASGFCFPMLVLWIRASQLQAAGSTAAPGADLLLWLVAAVPLAFGVLGLLFGRQHDKLRQRCAQLSMHGKVATAAPEALAPTKEELAREAEFRELKQTVHRFEQAVGALDSGFAMYDANERLIICNQAYCDTIRVPKALLAMRPTYEELVRGCFTANPEFAAHLPDGMTMEEWIPARLAEFRTPKGASLGFAAGKWTRLDDRKTLDGCTVCLRTDVTSFIKAEFEARVQEQRLKLAATGAGIGIWETDLATNQVVFDARTQAIHGHDEGTFPGTLEAWKSRIHPEDLPRIEVNIERSVREGGTDFQDTYRIILPNGQVRHIDRRGSYVKDERGKLLRRLGTNLDITEHVEIAETLRAAVADAQAATKAKAEFLATMSHEIRTPMNGVIGMTELLLDTQLSEGQREQVETIRTSGEALLSLINDILDFSKIEAGKLVLEEVPFSLTRVTRDCLSLFAKQAESKGVKLLHEVPVESADVLGDPGRLRQILLNLISNGLKFTHEGHVRVRVSIRPTSEARCHAEIEVSDTGIGMSPDYLGRFGEAFSQADASTTRHFGGTGLGLSICRNLIQLMGGALEVHSTLGDGSRFLVSIPMQAASSEHLASAVSLRTGPSGRLKRVLVAEDNLVNQRVVTLMLKKYADQVDVAVDGREAVERFKTATYDCVLMDGHMPELDGLEATRLIRAYEKAQGSPRTPIIALTASTAASEREAFLASGMDEYVAKPVRSQDLAAAFKRVERVRAALK